MWSYRFANKVSIYVKNFYPWFFWNKKCMYAIKIMHAVIYYPRWSTASLICSLKIHNFHSVAQPCAILDGLYSVICWIIQMYTNLLLRINGTFAIGKTQAYGNLLISHGVWCFKKWLSQWIYFSFSASKMVIFPYWLLPLPLVKFSCSTQPQRDSFAH